MRYGQAELDRRKAREETRAHWSGMIRSGEVTLERVQEVYRDAVFLVQCPAGRTDGIRDAIEENGGTV